MTTTVIASGKGKASPYLVFLFLIFFAAMIGIAIAWRVHLLDVVRSGRGSATERGVAEGILLF